MERHIKRIHEKHLMTKFKCPKCSYTTVWKDQMREHFSVIHQVFTSLIALLGLVQRKVTSNEHTWIIIYNVSSIF